MIEVNVNTSVEYKVLIKQGLLSEIGIHIKPFVGAGKIFLITDEIVYRLYGSKLCESLMEQGFVVFSHVIKAGESHKNLSSYAQIIKEMANKEFNRKDTIVALGGGVVGDLSGFVASTYMRGINFIQLPTTLLATIDAAVGGKNGIDIPEGKNYVGTFYQPKLVLIDPVVFDTLSTAEMQNGIGEGIKYAVLVGGEILSILEFGLTKDNVTRFVELCVRYKTQIVENDEREKGQRMLLNLGHTMGHAMEKLSRFTLSHGQSIIKGLYMIITAPGEDTLSNEDRTRIFALMNQYEFDVTIPYTHKDLLVAAQNDKKAEPGNFLNLVVVRGIGRCEVIKLSKEEVCSFFGVI